MVLEPGETSALECRIVVAVDVVDADHPFAAGEQCEADVVADEAGATGNDDRHASTFSCSKAGTRPGAECLAAPEQLSLAGRGGPAQLHAHSRIRRGARSRHSRAPRGMTRLRRSVRERTMQPYPDPCRAAAFRRTARFACRRSRLGAINGAGW